MENFFPNLITDPQNFRSSYRCKYLIIGTGPGGSVAGELLASKGEDVIFIEEGGFFPSYSCSANIGEMTARIYRNGGVFPFIGSPTIAFAEGCCVGGGSIINGGLIWRTPSWVLKDWEISYGLKGYEAKTIEKHFETIEKYLNVTRHKIEIGKNMDSAIIAKGADDLGWKRTLVPRAVNNCTYDNLCATGCPSGAKQTMLETYLPSALNNGARIFAGMRARKIEWTGKKATGVIAQPTNTKGKRSIIFKFDKLLLAGGAIQTPHLLRKSRCSKKAGQKLEFHLNLKIAAEFNNPIYAEKGTIFTIQVQEFEREGFLLMASNLRPNYLAITLSHFEDETIKRAINNYSHYGIYTVMIKSKSKAHIISGLGDQPLVFYRFDPADLCIIKKALRRSAKLLFSSGARRLYMPIAGTQSFSSFTEFSRILNNLHKKDLEIISVHAMASCPMGNRTHESVVNQDGRLYAFDNIYIVDASILPTNIGESPQGTIMAFASEIASRLSHLSP